MKLKVVQETPTINLQPGVWFAVILEGVLDSLHWTKHEADVKAKFPRGLVVAVEIPE